LKPPSSQTLYHSKMEHFIENALAQIKPFPVPWLPSNHLFRKLEISLTQLRIECTRITHTHLITHLDPFTCHQLTMTRNFHNVLHNHSILLALSNNSEPIHNSFSFLRSIQPPFLYLCVSCRTNGQFPSFFLFKT